MQRRSVIRIILNILIIVLTLLFIVSLLYFVDGSQELDPAEEQDGKARLAAAVMMLILGIPCAALIAVRIRFRKHR